MYFYVFYVFKNQKVNNTVTRKSYKRQNTVFISNVLREHSHTHSLLCGLIYGCLHVTMQRWAFMTVTTVTMRVKAREREALPWLLPGRPRPSCFPSSLVWISSCSSEKVLLASTLFALAKWYLLSTLKLYRKWFSSGPYFPLHKRYKTYCGHASLWHFRALSWQK